MLSFKIKFTKTFSSPFNFHISLCLHPSIYLSVVDIGPV